jgi:DNA-binding NarL/FixJ family response regulator
LGLVDTIRKTFAQSAILVLSDLADHKFARKALTLGAAGIVLKIQSPSVLLAAIKDLFPHYALTSGHKRWPTDIKQHPLNRDGQRFSKRSVSEPADVHIDRLTTRERQIVHLIGLGLRNKEIANRLSISDITVRHHLTNIFCKLEVPDRQKLLIFAHRFGLAELLSLPKLNRISETTG